MQTFAAQRGSKNSPWLKTLVSGADTSFSRREGRINRLTIFQESRPDMPVTSIAASSLFQPSVTPGVQNKFQQIQRDFQQLGQDLKAGNLTKAQQDFATLSQNVPIAQQETAASTSSAAQAF